MVEANLIATAIEGLYGGPLKDYVFPVVLSFLSAGIAAAIAYFVVNHQDKLKAEKGKIDILNKWVLKFDAARENLMSIKREYNETLGDNPYFRLTVIPSNPLSGEYLGAKYEELSFLGRWALISHIRGVVGNYNKVIGVWEQRHRLNEHFKESMRVVLSDPNEGFDSSVMIKAYGQARLIQLIDVNELAITQTDVLLKQLDELIVILPRYASNKINSKALELFGPLLEEKRYCSSDFKDLMLPSKIANYEYISELFGESVDSMSARYNRQ